MIFKTADSKNIFYIFTYCCIFLFLRLITSINGFTVDEAEQLFDSQKYYLGYSDQPPLFSWIIKTLSFIFGLNIPLMMVVTHILIFAFLLTVYFICRKIWNEQRSLIVVATMVLVFLYSYDFYRYMIHTILMTLMAALSLFIYLTLLKEKSVLNYSLLGIFFAAGILSKYNFAFFIATLFITSLSFREGRCVLFSYKVLFSLAVFFFILAPHLLWVFEHNFNSVSYALWRSEAGTQEFKLLEIFWLGFWNHLLLLLLFLLPIKKNENQSPFVAESEVLALRFMGLYGIIIPALVILFLHTGNFTNRWLSALYFSFVIAIFTFIDFDKLEQKAQIKKNFLRIIIAFILIIYVIKAAAYFFPDRFGIMFLHKPYKAIYSDLEQKLREAKLINSSINELDIYSYKEKSTAAAVKVFYPLTEPKIISGNSEIALRERKSILIWNLNKFKSAEILQDLNSKNLYLEKPITKLKAKHLHSQNTDEYVVGIAELKRKI